MLRWLRANLRPIEVADEAVLWAAVALGFFFLLRASEYLDVGYRAPNRGLLGRNVELKRQGEVGEAGQLAFTDEVVVRIRGSKTDIYNRGETRNHFQVKPHHAAAPATLEDAAARIAPGIPGETTPEDQVCVVSAVRMLFQHFPQRYLGGTEENEPLLRYSSGAAATRGEVQAMLGRAAVALGHSDHHFGSHSLRFGGASAIWAAYHDSAMVKRWGRWASDAFQGYLWESRKGSEGVATAMANVDMTPS
jgi:hypothetical protein